MYNLVNVNCKLYGVGRDNYYYRSKRSTKKKEKNQIKRRLPCDRCWCVFGAWRTALRLRAGAVPSPAAWSPRCWRWTTSLDTCCCRSCPPPTPFWSCPTTPSPPPCPWPSSDGPPAAAARSAATLGSSRSKKGCLYTTQR